MLPVPLFATASLPPEIQMLDDFHLNFFPYSLEITKTVEYIPVVALLNDSGQLHLN